MAKPTLKQLEAAYDAAVAARQDAERVHRAASDVLHKAEESELDALSALEAARLVKRMEATSASAPALMG